MCICVVVVCVSVSVAEKNPLKTKTKFSFCLAKTILSHPKMLLNVMMDNVDYTSPIY